MRHTFVLLINRHPILLLRNCSMFLLVHASLGPSNESGKSVDIKKYRGMIESHLHALHCDDLWDLPSTQLKSVEGDSKPRVVIEGPEKLNLSNFDFFLALNQVLDQVGFGEPCAVEWKFWKFVAEPEFGPGLPVQTVYIMGKIRPEDGNLKDICKWMCIQSCLNWLVEVKPSSDRVGPLAVVGLVNDSMHSEKLKIPPTLVAQEYPPGVKIVPMGSRTAKPFRTTNLIVFANGNNNQDDYGIDNFVAHGDALIIDPGCRSEFHEELAEVVAALPRKLVVLVTHHHRDHVDGLSTVQKSNPDASLLVHQYTMRRIKKEDWSLGYTAVSGGEEICIGGQRLRVIFAPGHTDGHVALLHVSTHLLIVGDHCVGQGSAILDITSGGNMNEYFQTTYKFMELSPHALLPMHGRVNLWPKHMLCGYLKNRRNRESSILKAIEAGAQTLYDIVAYTYADVDRTFWIPAASNVRLHVDYLALQNKLPQEFSIEKFQKTCRLGFLFRWAWAYLSSGFLLKNKKLRRGKLVGAVAIAAFAVLYSVRNKLFNSK
ncbi:hypothetical protein LguiB_015901 [Lonicera macranthoides]